jgi:hypothetical protein
MELPNTNASISNPLYVFSKYDLLASIVKFGRPTIRVIGDILVSLERSTFLKKTSESARTKRMRRVTSNNPSLCEAAFQHPSGINPRHRTSAKFSAVPTGRGKERPSGIGAQSRNFEIGVEDVFEQMMGVGIAPQHPTSPSRTGGSI